MAKTSTATELAKLSGKSVSAVTKQMKRHGVPSVKGRYDTERALAAMELGRQLDKRNAAKEVQKIESKGSDEHGLVYKTKLAQLRKVELQCDHLKTELDKVREKLADVDEIANRFTRLLSDIALRLNTWKESTIAKRPKMRKEIDEVARQLQLMIAEAGE